MSNVVLISIHPEHVSNILSGKKAFEYRKVVPKNDVTHLVLYCTAPIKKIVAIVEVLRCVTGSPSKVWSETSFGSGISRSLYRQYFAGQPTANAFHLGHVYKMTEPMNLSSLSGSKVSPQAFYYLDDIDIDMIKNKQDMRPAVAPNMLFVGGVHGVGKTTFCNKAFSPVGYQCVTASSLISADRNEMSVGKRVNDVSSNQVALLRQLDVEKARYCRLLLDGHFSLINKLDEIETVGIDVFQSMSPDLLILIKGSHFEIAERLKQRDGRKWKISLIKKFQEVEEEHANRVASLLGLQLITINNDMGYAAIAKMIGKKLSGEEKGVGGVKF